MKKEKIFRVVAVFLFVFFVDYFSKVAAHLLIPPIQGGVQTFPFGGIPVFKNFLGIDFCLNLVTNQGAAWGFLSSFSVSLLFLRIFAIGALFFYMLFSKKTVGLHFPLILIIAGALGNVVDCFIYGHVIDMFHFILWGYDFPVFNIADTVIFLGVMWMILLSFFYTKKSCPI